jgi:hypothetical protein
MGNKAVAQPTLTPEEIHQEISKKNDFFKQDMITIEKNSKKHISNIQHFKEQSLKGNSSFVLTRIFNFSECNVIECFSILENQVNVLYLPKEFNSKYFEIRWTNKKEIFYFSQETSGIDHFSLKSIDLNSSNSKEYHSSTEFSPETSFLEFQCEFLQHFTNTDFIWDFKIINGVLYVFNPKKRYRKIDFNSKEVIDLQTTDMGNSKWKLSAKSNFCITQNVKIGKNLLDLETGLTYFLEGLHDISSNGKLLVSVKNQKIEMFQMSSVLIKKNRSFQSFDFLDPINLLIFTEDSKFLIILSYQAIPSDVRLSLLSQYFISIYSIECQCLIVRFPYGKPRDLNADKNLGLFGFEVIVQNIGKYLFIQDQEKGVDVFEIQFIKNIPSGYFHYMQDLHFKFK